LLEFKALESPHLSVIETEVDLIVFEHCELYDAADMTQEAWTALTFSMLCEAAELGFHSMAVEWGVAEAPVPSSVPPAVVALGANDAVAVVEVMEEEMAVVVEGTTARSSGVRTVVQEVLDGEMEKEAAAQSSGEVRAASGGDGDGGKFWRRTPSVLVKVAADDMVVMQSQVTSLSSTNDSDDSGHLFPRHVRYNAKAFFRWSGLTPSETPAARELAAATDVGDIAAPSTSATEELVGAETAQADVERGTPAKTSAVEAVAGAVADADADAEVSQVLLAELTAAAEAQQAQQAAEAEAAAALRMATAAEHAVATKLAELQREHTALATRLLQNEADAAAAAAAAAAGPVSVCVEVVWRCADAQAAAAVRAVTLEGDFCSGAPVALTRSAAEPSEWVTRCALRSGDVGVLQLVTDGRRRTLGPLVLDATHTDLRIVVAEPTRM
jgi:hypothetical protein